jgi:nitric oxide dioxygenase
MSLSAEEIEILRDSLRLFQTRRSEIADAFYENLFRAHPDLRAMFDPDIEAQTEKTMLALGAIVAQIHRVEAFRPMVEDLALRHVTYGVRAEHYPFVGEALLATIRDVFGDTLGPEIFEAWRVGYAEIAAHMIDSAYPERRTDRGAVA